MKILTYRSENTVKWGVSTERGVLTIPGQRFSIQPIHTMDFIQTLVEQRSALCDWIDTQIAEADDDCFLNETELVKGPCVVQPSKIVCVGLNYRKHAIESNMPVPTAPVIFSKFSNTLSGHDDTVMLPRDSVQNDYEAELGIVIGKQAKHVPPFEALDYVFGYCNANDLSVREWQFRNSQWLLGKSADGFCPVGPYLVTADEVQDPNRLSIVCKVNGEIRQDSNTSDMIFNCAEIISYLSDHMTLMPGDLILTGTPEGVVMGYPQEKQVWLQDGDRVTVEIEGLGLLANRIKKQS
ncbi:fumarylacetoacetate hydrolase family protein [Paenibacillus sp. BR2-3]|uniref:fumarylacetoacetate hydrolase family protein n=1 Tax=Paenibacillus sp. BR2-3 TaxID=3048494 RepID=UPI0039775ACE